MGIVRASKNAIYPSIGAPLNGSKGIGSEHNFTPPFSHRSSIAATKDPFQLRSCAVGPARNL